MRNKRPPLSPPAPSAGGPEADQLDALNSRMRARRDSSQRIRRAMERQIEAKAERARRDQTASSSAWKR